MANYRLPEIEILTQKEINKLPRAERWKYRADCLKAARFWLIKNDNIQIYDCIDKVELYMKSGYRMNKMINKKNKNDEITIK